MPIVGDPAPHFDGDDFIHDMITYDTRDHLGDIILLSFIEYDDSDCEDVIKCLVNLWNTYSGHGVQIVAVVRENSTPTSVIKTWLTGEFDVTVTFPAIHNEDIWSSYMGGIPVNDRVVPHTFIIDRNMHIRERFLGFPGRDFLEGLLKDTIYIRDPIDLEMVMDVSGSMNWPLTGDSKFEMMKRACRIIGNFLNTNGQIDDNMGLISFTDDVSEDQTLLPIKANWDITNGLKDKINALVTGTCTAMGAGLQTAFDTLPPSTPTRKSFVILCTDGIQNINPLVKKVPAGHYEIINGDDWCGDPSQIVSEHPGDNIANYNIPVHTIGVGITANYETLLQGIANQTGAFYQGTNDPETDLDFLYLIDLCNIMAGGSPSILYHNTSNLSVEEHKKAEIFYLNRSIRKITVILSWKKSQRSNFMFWLYSPDGTLLDLHNEMRLYENHCMATIYLPKRQNGESLEYLGGWRMIIRGEIIGTSADYHAFVIGEDTVIKHVVDFPKKLYEVGDLLPIRIIVLNKKKPVFIMPKEIVIETKYFRVPLPELLAQYKVSPFELLKKSKISTKKVPKNLLILKLKAMTSDPHFQKHLIPYTKHLSLLRGDLECKIEKEEIFIPIALEQPGLHSFKIKVRYESPENGPICRTDMISLIVGPGKADPEQTKINFIETSTDKLKGKIINITPRNKKGQLLGPGYSYELKLQVGKKEFDIKIKDLLDGTYQIELPVSEKEMVEIKEKDLDVDITFHNNLIWRGKL